jgi:hypothetical protein
MHTAQTSALNRLLATKDNIHSATLLCTHWQHSPQLGTGTSGLLGLSLSIDCLLSTTVAQVSLSSGPQPSRSASIRMLLLLLLLLLPCSSSLLA